jgi:hypothetical protein
MRQRTLASFCALGPLLACGDAFLSAPAFRGALPGFQATAVKPSFAALRSATRGHGRTVVSTRMAIDEIEYVKLFGRLGEKTLFGDSSAVSDEAIVCMVGMYAVAALYNP